MEILVYGVINSLTLALMAIGFNLIYGISRIANFAHGAIYILGGFAIYMGLNLLGLNYVLSAILAFLALGLLGGLIYKIVLIRVRGMAISEIIVTYSIGLAILEGLRWGGFKGTTYTLPAFKQGYLLIFDVPVDMQRLLIVIIGVLVFILLWAFTHYTKIGLALRGMAQDERAAMMLGIDTDFMAVVAMALGSILAGAAALALLPLGTIAVEGGYNVLTMAIAVCIVGGLGSWVGAILAAFVIGFLQILTWVYIASHFQIVVALMAILVTLLVKPSGILGKQKELEERV